jgi:hypothetical protein
MGSRDPVLQSVMGIDQLTLRWGRYFAAWMSPSLDGLAKMSAMVYV